MSSGTVQAASPSSKKGRVVAADSGFGAVAAVLPRGGYVELMGTAHCQQGFLADRGSSLRAAKATSMELENGLAALTRALDGPPEGEAAEALTAASGGPLQQLAAPVTKAPPPEAVGSLLRRQNSSLKELVASQQAQIEALREAFTMQETQVSLLAAEGSRGGSPNRNAATWRPVGPSPIRSASASLPTMKPGGGDGIGRGVPRVPGGSAHGDRRPEQSPFGGGAARRPAPRFGEEEREVQQRLADRRRGLSVDKTSSTRISRQALGARVMVDSRGGYPSVWAQQPGLNTGSWQASPVFLEQQKEPTKRRWVKGLPPSLSKPGKAAAEAIAASAAVPDGLGSRAGGAFDSPKPSMSKTLGDSHVDRFLRERACRPRLPGLEGALRDMSGPALEDIVRTRLLPLPPKGGLPAAQPSSSKPVELEIEAGNTAVVRYTDGQIGAALRRHFHGSVNAAFRAFDADQDRLISRFEFQRGLKICGLSLLPEERVEHLWRRAGGEENDFLFYEQFATLFKPP